MNKNAIQQQLYAMSFRTLRIAEAVGKKKDRALAAVIDEMMAKVKTIVE